MHIILIFCRSYAFLLKGHFLAVMAARNSKSELKCFYKNLIARGKEKMVALTALIRKIIVIANSRLRDFYAQNMTI